MTVLHRGNLGTHARGRGRVSLVDSLNVRLHELSIRLGSIFGSLNATNERISNGPTLRPLLLLYITLALARVGTRWH